MDIKELADYSEAQFKTIVKLQEENKQLKEENARLETILSVQAPIQVTNIPGILSERIVCETQIYLLKERAIRQELTLEEARKLQIYTDILEKIGPREKSNELKIEATEAELLHLVADGNSK